MYHLSPCIVSLPNKRVQSNTTPQPVLARKLVNESGSVGSPVDTIVALGSEITITGNRFSSLPPIASRTSLWYLQATLAHGLNPSFINLICGLAFCSQFHPHHPKGFCTLMLTYIVLRSHERSFRYTSYFVCARMKNTTIPLSVESDHASTTLQRRWESKQGLRR
jgi:hypothetical protein